jgi:transposase
MFKLDRRRYRVGEPEPAYCREADLDKPDVCGIDVSAKELVVMVERCGRREGARNFSNTASGHQQLRDYLAAPGRQVRVCLEATGLYGLDVALWLERDARFQVMVANPRAVKNFARLCSNAARMIDWMRACCWSTRHACRFKPGNRLRGRRCS